MINPEKASLPMFLLLAIRNAQYTDTYMSSPFFTICFLTASYHTRTCTPPKARIEYTTIAQFFECGGFLYFFLRCIHQSPDKILLTTCLEVMHTRSSSLR